MSNRAFFLSCGAGLIVATSLFAQISAFPSPSYFRETFSKPDTRVELAPPARLSDFVVNGKLELSLRSYLELVMANNTEIAISRLSVETARNQITRSYAPFDPLLQASFTNRRSRTPSTDVLQGAQTLSTLNQPAQFGYTQTLQNGISYRVDFNASKTATNSGFQNFNPALNSNLGVSFSQPLLRNRGTYVNRLNIMLARSRLRKTEYDLRDTLLRLIETAESAYWDVVLAREDLKVQENALNLAKEALARTEKELQLGATSPLEIYSPQQRVAAAEITVSQARYRLLQTEDALRRQIGADLDPDIRKLPIELTEDVMPSGAPPAIDVEMAVEKALALRPDMKSALQNLDIDELAIQSARNNLKPDLALTGSYTTQGRGGVFYQRENVFDEPGRAPITRIIPGGFGDALDQMFGFGFPVYSFGLTLRLPIRDRNAAANLADALVQKRRDTLLMRSVEQQVRLDVLTAANQLQASKAAVDLAMKSVEFARKYLEAEKKKYELGTSQIFFVLQAQADLVNAESEVVQNAVRYRRAQLNLLRRTGELLEERGIAIQQ